MRRASALTLGAVLCGLAGTPVFAIDADWDGGTGDWEIPGNWAAGTVPTNNTFDVLIDNGDGTASLVTLSVSRTINSLTVDALDQLTILNNRTLTLSQLTNNGTVLLDGAGNTTRLLIAGSATFDGSGTIIMKGPAATQILGQGFGNQLTVGNAMTIRGGGSIGVNILNIVNDGTIIAEDAATALAFDPFLTFLNNGLVQATGAAGIVLDAGTHDNQGTFEVLSGSKLVTTNGAVLKGVFTNTAGGDFTFAGPTTLDAFTLEGAATVANNITVNVDNGLTVNGTLTLGGLGNTTQLVIFGDETIGGTGEIVMQGSASTRLTAQSFGDVLTLGGGLTVQGEGNIGVNVANVVNNGTIRATSNSVVMLLDPQTDLTNHGTIRAEGAAGIVLAAGLFDNQGLIEISDGSKIQTSNGTTLKGTVTNTGTGQFIATANTTFDGVTIEGTATVANNSTVTVDNGLVVNGTLTLAGLGNLTQLSIAGDETFSGSGEIVMEGSVAGTRLTSANFNDILTLGSGITVRGLGDVGANTANIVNNGTIRATSNSVVILLDPRTDLTNHGTIRAEGAAGIVLAPGLFDNQGLIEISDGSKIQTSNGTTLKGAVTNTGTGQFIATANTTFDGVTIEGTATVANNSTVTVDNGLVVNGTLTLAGLGNLTQLSIAGDETFSGSGEIVMEGSVASTRLTGANFNDVLTLGSGITVRGLGNVGFNVIDLVNQGTIRATSNAGVLVLDPRTVLTNLGTIRAEGTSGLVLAAGLFDNQGLLEVSDGSTIDTSNGTTLKGGLTNTGTGQLRFAGNTRLDGVTVIGSATIVNNATVYAENGLTLDGMLTLAGLGNLTQLSIDGDQTIGGSGDIVMVGSATSTRITGLNFDDLLTIGSGVSVRGAGVIGANTIDLVNQGVIQATSNALVMTIDPRTFLNNQGTLRASGSAGLVLDPAAYNNTGNIIIDAGSKIDADAASVQFTNDTSGVISGEGTLLVNSAFTNKGTLSPGMSPGTLSILGDVTNDDTATLLVEIAGSGPGEFDLLNVSGTYDVDGELVIRFLNGAETLLETDILTVVDAASLVQSNLTLAFDSVSIEGSGSFTVNYDDAAGLIQITGFKDIVPVPEPASLALMAIAGAVLLRQRRAA